MSNYDFDRFPEPPDDPDEGNCWRCKRWITRDELLQDGCTECDDLLIEDMKLFWNGRSKAKTDPELKYYVFDSGKNFISQQRFVHTGYGWYLGKDWTGML